MSNPSLKLKAIKKAREYFRDSLKRCAVCPRKCLVDRTIGKAGYCRAGLESAVYSYSTHHGEEPPLSGTRGSGTIFFSGCNMKCVYCQNYYFSQLDNGEAVSAQKLSRMMLYLDKIGCHNINLVSPSHFVPQILMGLKAAIEEGLDIPIVYNTGGYDSLDTIKALDGVIDIYMPDMRYSEDAMAKKYSDAPDYVTCNRECIKEMQRQGGDLVLDDNGIAQKGLIIRLLVLPEDISGTRRTLKFIREEISQKAYLSIMSQYYPTFKAYNFKDISRPISGSEYKNVVDEANLLGLNNGWVQESPEDSDPKFFGTNIKPR